MSGKVIYEIGFIFFRWLAGIGEILNGLCVVASLGVWTPAISLTTEKWFLDWCDREKPNTEISGQKAAKGTHEHA